MSKEGSTYVAARQVAGSEGDKDIWVAEPELRHRLGYSASTMRRLRVRGLPSVASDRLRRYHWPTVLQWLSENA